MQGCAPPSIRPLRPLLTALPLSGMFREKRERSFGNKRDREGGTTKERERTRSWKLHNGRWWTGLKVHWRFSRREGTESAWPELEEEMDPDPCISFFFLCFFFFLFASFLDLFRAEIDFEDSPAPSLHRIKSLNARGNQRLATEHGISILW